MAYDAVHLRLCSFYPSATSGGIDLEWETCLESSGNATQPRLHSSVRNTSWNSGTPALRGSPASAHLEFRGDGVECVLCAWDEPFEGEAWEGVMLEQCWIVCPLCF
jgi:hypothetical protein